MRRRDIMPVPAFDHDAGMRTVNIYVTRDVAYDITKLERVTRTVLGKLGCDGCHSGRDLRIRVMDDYVVNPKTLDVKEVVQESMF
jgi:hypothetical protein